MSVKTGFAIVRILGGIAILAFVVGLGIFSTVTGRVRNSAVLTDEEMQGISGGTCSRHCVYNSSTATDCTEKNPHCTINSGEYGCDGQYPDPECPSKEGRCGGTRFSGTCTEGINRQCSAKEYEEYDCFLGTDSNGKKVCKKDTAANHTKQNCQGGSFSDCEES